MQEPTASGYRFLIMNLFLVAAGFFLYPFWVPLLAGLIFSMAIAPLMERSRWITSRRLRAGILTFLFAAVFLAPLGAGIYFGANAGLAELKRLQQTKSHNLSLPNTTDTKTFLEIWLERTPKASALLKRFPNSEKRILEFTAQGLSYVSKKASDLSERVIRAVPGVVISSIVILFTIFFILADGYRTRTWLFFNPVFNPTDSTKIIRTFQQASYSVVLAAVVSAFCQAAILMTGSLITGKGDALMIATITFFCSFIPVIGTMPVSATLVLYQFMSGNSSAAVIFLIFGLVASLIDNFVYPSIVGGHSRLHPLLAFVSAFGALEMIGVYGIFIGPVTMITFLKITSIQTKRLKPALTFTDRKPRLAPDLYSQ